MPNRPADAMEASKGHWYAVRNGEEVWLCRDCWQHPEGASWNGRCLGCHEASLVPIGPEGLEDTGETWSDVYLGRVRDVVADQQDVR